MVLSPKQSEYNRSSSACSPNIEGVSIELTREITLTLNIPTFRIAESPSEGPEFSSSFSRVVSAHATFKAAMLPNTDPGDSVNNACIAEVNAIYLCFPGIESDFLRIVFTAWLAFACMMDDILEKMPLEDREISLHECIKIVLNILDHLPPRLVSITTFCQDRRIQDMTRVLYNHCIQYLSKASARAFFEAVRAVFEGHVDEVRFVQRKLPNNFPTYMAIRSRTIALNPFFEVIKTEFLAEGEWQFNSAWEKLQLEVSRVAGLQNDLVGLVRDLKDGEQLNAVIVMMDSYGGIHKGDPNPALLSWCVANTSTEHNQCVTRCLYYASRLHVAAYESQRDDSNMARTEVVVRHILQLCETHLQWCASAKRYGLESCVSQRHNISPYSPSPLTACDSRARVAMVGVAPYADEPEDQVSTTSDCITKSRPQVFIPSCNKHQGGEK